MPEPYREPERWLRSLADPLPIFWTWPRMTTSLLAFNMAATIYLVVGSLHEQARYRDAYAAEYVAYVNCGVSFYVPVPNGRQMLKSLSAVSRPGEIQYRSRSPR